MVEDMHPANGRVTIREVYGLIKESHSELGEKIDHLCARFDAHCDESHGRDIRIQKLEDWSGERDKSREHILTQIEDLTKRAPRRKSDPDTENWGRSVYGGEDKEVGDMKRAWRVLKWLVVTAISPVIVALGLELQERLF